MVALVTLYFTICGSWVVSSLVLCCGPGDSFRGGGDRGGTVPGGQGGAGMMETG